MKEHIKGRILIIDDNQPLRDLLTEYLSKCGHFVLTTYTWDERTEHKFNLKEIDIVILDWDLNVKDKTLAHRALIHINMYYPKVKVLIYSSCLKSVPNGIGEADRHNKYDEPKALKVKIRKLLKQKKEEEADDSIE